MLILTKTDRNDRISLRYISHCIRNGGITLGTTVVGLDSRFKLKINGKKKKGGNENNGGADVYKERGGLLLLFNYSTSKSTFLF